MITLSDGQSIRSRAVVPNRGSAAQKGSVKRYLGCHQTLNLLPFLVFLILRVPRIVILARVRVPRDAKFFSVLQGSVNQKRFEKHWSRDTQRLWHHKLTFVFRMILTTYKRATFLGQLGYWRILVWVINQHDRSHSMGHKVD